jgi:hypothetical protein
MISQAEQSQLRTTLHLTDGQMVGVEALKQRVDAINAATPGAIDWPTVLQIMLTKGIPLVIDLLAAFGVPEPAEFKRMTP